MPKAIFICKEIETGVECELEIDELKAFEAPLREIRQGNKRYQIIDKKGSSFGLAKNQKRFSHGVTKRESWNCGVHRDQVPEARDLAKKLHSGIEVKDSGTMVFSDRNARKVWVKAQGMVDRDGGYSD